LTQAAIDLAIYRLYRSNALWFAQRKEGYSVTLNEGNTYSFAKGEMLQCALGWVEKSKEFWDRLLSDGIVEEVCGAECICPECTRAEIMRLKGDRID